jgi:hypothetical protein
LATFVRLLFLQRVFCGREMKKDGLCLALAARSKIIVDRRFLSAVCRYFGGGKGRRAS